MNNKKDAKNQICDITHILLRFFIAYSLGLRYNVPCVKCTTKRKGGTMKQETGAKLNRRGVTIPVTVSLDKETDAILEALAGWETGGNRSKLVVRAIRNEAVRLANEYEERKEMAYEG